MATITRGSITITVQPDAVTYYIVPSVSTITKSSVNELSPSSITCLVYKVVGNSSPVEDTEKILKYKREGVDSSEVVYSGAITITLTTTSVMFNLYDTDGTTILDSSRVPVLNDAGDIEVGGVNLLLGSRDFTNSNFKYVYKDGTTYNDCSVSKREFPSDSTSSSIDHVHYQNITILKANTYYTLSFWAKASDDGVVVESLLSSYYSAVCSNSYNSSGHKGTATNGLSIHTFSTEWKRYWVVFKTLPTLAESLSCLTVVARNRTKGSTTYIAGVKFEIGNKATDWSPNPLDVKDDVQEGIDGIEIGGTNLLPQTSNEWVTKTSPSGDSNINPFDSGSYRFSLDTLHLKAGDTITAQVEIKDCAKAAQVQLGEYDSANNATYTKGNGVVVGTQGKSIVTFQIKDTTVDLSIMINCRAVSTSVTYRGLKIEKGNKATDWSPAPEDIENAIQEGIDSIDIGGVNLFPFKRFTNNLTAARGTIDSIEDYRIIMTSTGSDCYTYSYTSTQKTRLIAVEPNTEYIFSFKKKYNVSGPTYIFFWPNADNSYTSNTYFTTTSRKFTTPADTTYISIRFGIASSGNTEEFYDIQLEKGNKQTAWSPSYEDINQSITDLQDYIEGAYSDGIITLSEAKNIKELAISDKATIDEQYNVTYNNPKISSINQSNLGSKYNASYVVTYNGLITACDNIINADTITTALQTALATAYTSYKTSRTALMEQFKTCSQQINSDTSSSLAAAQAAASTAEAKTNGFTSIENGLILTNLIKFFNSSNEETGGISGDNSYGSNAVGAWFGGTFAEAIDNLAKIILRFNGTAKLGNYEINSNGDFIAYDTTSGDPMVLITKSTVDRNTVVAKPEPSTTEIWSKDCGIFSRGGASAPTSTAYSTEIIEIEEGMEGGRAAVIGITLTADASANYNANATITASLVVGTLLLCEIGTVTAAGGTIKQQSFTVGTETDSSGSPIGRGDLRIQFTYSYTNGGVSTSTYKLSYSKTTEGTVTNVKPHMAIGQNGFIVSTPDGESYRYVTSYQGSFSDFIKAGNCGLQHTKYHMKRMMNGSLWKAMPEIVLMGKITRNTTNNTISTSVYYNPKNVTVGCSRLATGVYNLSYGNLLDSGQSQALSAVFTDVKKDANYASYAMSTTISGTSCTFTTQDDDSVNDILSLTYIIIKHFNNS